MTQATLADALALSVDEIEGWMMVLAPRCEYGPYYLRSVASKVSDARLFLSRDDLPAATHYVQLARCAAGLLTWEQFCEIDPFRSA